MRVARVFFYPSLNKTTNKPNKGRGKLYKIWILNNNTYICTILLILITFNNKTE